jgi:hypothetical protein
LDLATDYAVTDESKKILEDESKIVAGAVISTNSTRFYDERENAEAIDRAQDTSGVRLQYLWRGRRCSLSFRRRCMVCIFA